MIFTPVPIVYVNLTNKGKIKMKKISADYFNFVFSNYLTCELTRDELQEFIETLLIHLRCSLKSTSDEHFQDYLFKQQTDNLKKDKYWLQELYK
tara:strand:+ start:238 stop:519 length:282 start_codon:yes stop_codon:yes gene_type:complete